MILSILYSFISLACVKIIISPISPIAIICTPSTTNNELRNSAGLSARETSKNRRSTIRYGLLTMPRENNVVPTSPKKRNGFLVNFIRKNIVNRSSSLRTYRPGA